MANDVTISSKLEIHGKFYQHFGTYFYDHKIGNYGGWPMGNYILKIIHNRNNWYLFGYDLWDFMMIDKLMLYNIFYIFN